VRGQALYQGQPMSGAVVIFHPLDRPEPRPYGRADEQGRFQLTTYKANDGAPAGAYAVSFWWRLNSEEEDQSQSLLPDRLTSPDTSAIRVAIAPGDNELPAFVLE
jgi:hypothetical protein